MQELPSAAVAATIGEKRADGAVPITLAANATALYVVLTTRAHGRFSDNAFVLEVGRNLLTWNISSPSTEVFNQYDLTVRRCRLSDQV